MFGFLKKTLDKAVGVFKKKVEEEAEVTEEVKEEAKEVKKEAKVEKKPEPKIEKKPEVAAHKPEPKPEPVVHKPEAKHEVRVEEKKVQRPEPVVVKKPEVHIPKVEEKKVVREEVEKKPAHVEVKKPEVKVPEREVKKVEEEEKEEPKKKGFFSFLSDKITKFKLSEDKFDELFWDLEVALMENNVAVEVIEKIKADLKNELTSDAIPRGNVEERIARTLKKSIGELFEVETFDLVKRVKTKKPFIIAMIGVNGSGKTTTLAKLIHLFQKNTLSVVVAASDTFRAAAIQQLEEHTTRLGVKLIKNDYKSDPAAVAFDAVEHAKAKNIDVVLIDTAGRLHSNTNLMDELKKVIRVAKPDLKIFIGESITGNDCVEQAKVFDEMVGIDAIILAKADVDEKGGAAVSVSYVTGKPILFLGTGQKYDDLQKFDEKIILESLGL